MLLRKNSVRLHQSSQNSPMSCSGALWESPVHNLSIYVAGVWSSTLLVLHSCGPLSIFRERHIVWISGHGQWDLHISTSGSQPFYTKYHLIKYLYIISPSTTIMLKYRGQTPLCTTRGGLKYHQWYMYHRLRITECSYRQLVTSSLHRLNIYMG